jgi:hypothetical protein
VSGASSVFFLAAGFAEEAFFASNSFLIASTSIFFITGVDVSNFKLCFLFADLTLFTRPLRANCVIAMTNLSFKERKGTAFVAISQINLS